MADGTGPGKEGLNAGRWKAFAVSLGVDMLCLPLIMVLLVVWPIFILAIAPYIGGALGGRYTDRRNGLLMGGLAAVIMVTVLVAIFISILTGIPGLGENFDPTESIGLSIVTGGYFTAFVFGALGGRHGAIAAEEED
jgi:hypothetical protein